MDIMVILIGHRVESAVKVQSVLTENGDIIKTRLGINRELNNDNDASGFVFLELCGEERRIREMCEEINTLNDVKAECLRMDLPGCSCQS
ncbi:MAG: hypothetical protein ACM3PE_04420 [Deltaproteobacteria bacterium]